MSDKLLPFQPNQTSRCAGNSDTFTAIDKPLAQTVELGGEGGTMYGNDSLIGGSYWT